MTQYSEPARFRPEQSGKEDSRGISARTLSELLERESRRYPTLLTSQTERRS